MNNIDWKAMTASTKVHTSLTLLEVLKREVSALYELTAYEKYEKFTDSEYWQLIDDIDTALNEAYNICTEISETIEQPESCTMA
jgi:Ser-tRNA(Ala) deacylase AlaX